MGMHIQALKLIALAIFSLFLASCSGNGSTTFTVSGTVSGLNTGSWVSLQNNGLDTLALSSNGKFTFATPLANGAAYSVTVSSQPTP